MEYLEQHLVKFFNKLSILLNNLALLLEGVTISIDFRLEAWETYLLGRNIMYDTATCIKKAMFCIRVSTFNIFDTLVLNPTIR